jgi:hypothetical protein
MFRVDGSEMGRKNDDQSKASSSKKVHFKNTVVAFISDGIDFWKYKCRTEPLHTKSKQSKNNRETFNVNFDNPHSDNKHIKNKRKRKKK